MSTKRTMVALAAAGLVAAGAGSAFTAGVTVNDNTVVLGYGEQTVSGAQVTNVAYQLSADKQNITKVDLTFDTNLTGEPVKAAFGSNEQTCTTTDANGMIWTCAFTNQTVSAASKLAITVGTFTIQSSV